MDKLTEKRLKLLHPAIRDNVRQWTSIISDVLLGKGVELRLAYTLRTVAEQNLLYSYGRTKFYDNAGNRKGKVTYVKGGYSIHNYGLAWDIVLLLDKDGNGTYESASWDIALDFDKDGTSDWMEVVKLYKEADDKVEWGGDWERFKDYPHFQIDFGYTAKQLKAKIDAGDYFTEIIDGKEYKWVNL